MKKTNQVKKMDMCLALSDVMIDHFYVSFHLCFYNGILSTNNISFFFFLIHLSKNCKTGQEYFQRVITFPVDFTWMPATQSFISDVLFT